MELLVRIVDKVNKDSPELDAKCTKAGDVIAVHEDGGDWGIMELKNPDWRIVSVPGMTQEEADVLLAPELPPTLDKEYPLLRKRQMKLDLSQLDALEGGKVLVDKVPKEDPKIDPAVDAVVDKANVLSVTILKERLVDPNVIGPVDDHVIGPT